MSAVPQHERLHTPTPNKDAYQQRLNRVMEANNMTGTCLIRGIERVQRQEEHESKEEDEDVLADDSNEEEIEADFSLEQLASLRYVLINQSRSDALEEMRAVLDPNDGWFDTHTGNSTIYILPALIQNCMEKETLAMRFDALFSLTFACSHVQDAWMFNNECYGRKADELGEIDDVIEALASAWRKLLKNDTRDLGIDTEYSAPGVKCMLQNFAECCIECPFVHTTFQFT